MVSCRKQWWRYSLIFVLILLLQGCFTNWSKKDKLLFTSLTALNAVDLAQYDKDNEANWFKGESQETVGLIKLIGLGAIYLIADSYEEARTPILTTGNVLFGGVVIWNASQK